MEENKYYTPSIEEFYVGFEYEELDWDEFSREFGENSTHSFKEREWLEYLNLKAMAKHLETHPNEIRVKYLDKEDIESFEFKSCGQLGIPYGIGDGYLTPDEEFCMIDHKKDNWYTISKKNKPNIYTNVFAGKIKNKSELAKILKMTGYGE